MAVEQVESLKMKSKILFHNADTHIAMRKTLYTENGSIWSLMVWYCRAKETAVPIKGMVRSNETIQKMLFSGWSATMLDAGSVSYGSGKVRDISVLSKNDGWFSKATLVCNGGVHA